MQPAVVQGIDMSENVTSDTIRRMIRNALESVTEHKDELSRLDAVSGDGDHGTAIVAALTAADRVAQQGSELKAMLTDIGFGVMSESCGSTSTLLGALFMGMGEAVESEELDAPSAVEMFAGGLACVQEQTKASVGDRTMMDALIPAVDVMRDHVDGGIFAVLTAAASCAEEGAAKTADLTARFGRARNLGDRVLGHRDPGAVSTAYILTAFAEAVSE